MLKLETDFAEKRLKIIEDLEVAQTSVMKRMVDNAISEVGRLIASEVGSKVGAWVTGELLGFAQSLGLGDLLGIGSGDGKGGIDLSGLLKIGAGLDESSGLNKLLEVIGGASGTTAATSATGGASGGVGAAIGAAAGPALAAAGGAAILYKIYDMVANKDERLFDKLTEMAKTDKELAEHMKQFTRGDEITGLENFQDRFGSFVVPKFDFDASSLKGLIPDFDFSDLDLSAAMDLNSIKISDEAANALGEGLGKAISDGIADLNVETQTDIATNIAEIIKQGYIDAGLPVPGSFTKEFSSDEFHGDTAKTTKEFSSDELHGFITDLMMADQSNAFKGRTGSPQDDVPEMDAEPLIDKVTKIETDQTLKVEVTGLPPVNLANPVMIDGVVPITPEEDAVFKTTLDGETVKIDNADGTPLRVDAGALTAEVSLDFEKIFVRLRDTGSYVNKLGG